MKHVTVSKLPCNVDHQALSRILVHHDQESKNSTVMGSMMHEVIGPDMIGVLWSKSYTGAVVKPQPTSFGLLFRHFQAFTSPQALYTFMVYLPTFPSKQRGDPAVLVTTELGRQLDNPFQESWFIIGYLGGSSLG